MSDFFLNSNLKSNIPKQIKIKYLPSDLGSVGSAALLLENVSDSMSRDLLLMLVENISGLDESHFGLEIMWESSRAVVTFNTPAGRG